MKEQLDEFLEDHGGIADRQEDLNKPKAPFMGSMRLTGKQEEALVKHAFQRLGELERESGRKLTGQSDWFSSLEGADLTNASRSYLGKRQLYKLIYQNKMNWRPHLLGGVFQDSNLVVPIARRIVRQMVARANNYFFGSDPWFGAHAIGDSDKELTTAIQRFAEWKFNQGNVTADLTTALENTFVKGEQVVKINHKVDDDYYTSTQSVMVDGSGNAYQDSQGNYIYDIDKWSENEFGTWVLERDPSVSRPDEYSWKDMEVKKRAVHYEGPEIKPIHERDFLFPLTAENLHEADCVVHLYDMPVMDLVDFYQRRDMLGTDDEKREATEKAIRMIQKMASARGTHSASQSALPEVEEMIEKGEQNEGEQNPIAKVAEFHMTYDVDGDGILENFMLVVERDTRMPIFYDFTAELTPDGKRPFEMWRINPVPERAYGIGAIEMFESTQNIIDLLVNRMNHSQSRAGRVDLWRPYNTVEGDRDPSLKLNWGQTYTPKPGIPDHEVLSSVYLNDVKSDELKQLSEYFSQMAMNESGIQHANDNLISGLHSTQLATGIRNIDSVGKEMFSLYTTHLRPQITRAVKRGIYCLLYYLQREESFLYFEGDSAITSSIDPENITGLDVDVRILMTQERNERLLESNTQATAILERFYALPTWLQEKQAPIFKEMLLAMQITSADQVITPGIAQHLPGSPEQPMMPEQQEEPAPTL